VSALVRWTAEKGYTLA